MKKALGKGLSALIPDSYVQSEKETEGTETDRSKTGSGQITGLAMISVEDILENEDQPRKDFSPDGIEELASSIREKGILQPVIVKRTGENEYRLVCGERRVKAARLCGAQEVPAVIKDVVNEDFLEWALIENVQREDLNAIEEAEAYQRLANERGMSQDEIAKRVGKDRSTVANMMRLLRLPQEIQAFLANGQLTSGHGRALLAMLTPEHQRQMAKRIIEENLSVRQVESIVNRSNAQKRKAKTARHLKPEVVDLEKRMEQHFGTQVRIFPRKDQKQGRIEIQYFSLDDLDRILQKMALPNSP